MADALDSKSSVGDYVWVQVPPSAPVKSRPPIKWGPRSLLADTNLYVDFLQFTID